MNLARLTNNVEQARELLNLGVNGFSILRHYFSGGLWFTAPMGINANDYTEVLPAWTKAELDAMIGPRFQKPDLWNDERLTKAQNPNTYPIFTGTACYIYDNGAVASAAGLIMLLQQEFLNPNEANERYEKIFLK
jgi:hypothetical protein